MPTAKQGFSLVHWKERGFFFNAGGFNGSYLNEVEEYSCLKNKWRLHSELPQAMDGSSVVVLHSIFYIIGGYGSSHSLLCCNLNSHQQPKWKGFDLQGVSLKGDYSRNAFNIENKIVYFGSSNPILTCVLEKEKYSEKLRVVKRDERTNFKYLYTYNTSCCFKNSIYAM